MRKAFARLFSVGALGFGVLPMLAGAPARADVGPPQNISITGVGYYCKATNAVIDQTIGGPQTFLINARATVPTSVAPGDTIPPEQASLDLTMPELLMNKIRSLPAPTEGSSVKTIGGSATSTVELEAVTSGGQVAGTLNPTVNGLSSTPQDVPASGPMTISNVTGTVQSVTVPSALPADDLVYVELPLNFELHAQLDPPILGSISSTDLDCWRLQDTAAQRVLGTITVGNGCSTTDCPLPAVDRSKVPSWVPAPSGGSGPSSGPSTAPTTGPSTAPVIPVQPVDPVQPVTAPHTTGTGTNPGTGSHHSGTGVNDPATTDVGATTELPDTGSPIAPWLFVVLGVAVLARVVLLVRQRRRTAGIGSASRRSRR